MFITNHPAMKLGGALVIADLHLGITRDLYEKGVSLPSQVDSLVEMLHALKKLSKTSRLVIAGDFKHKVPGISIQELREIPDFLDRLAFKQIVIVKGNHDGNIERLIPEILEKKVLVRPSFRIGNALITHGHRNVETTARVIIIGHNHPHVLFIDEMGAKYVQPCWLRGKAFGKKIIAMPAFNPLSGAMIVNKEKLHGPIATRMTGTRVYLLDGTDLGSVAALMIR